MVDVDGMPRPHDEFALGSGAIPRAGELFQPVRGYGAAVGFNEKDSFAVLVNHRSHAEYVCGLFIRTLWVALNSALKKLEIMTRPLFCHVIPKAFGLNVVFGARLKANHY